MTGLRIIELSVTGLHCGSCVALVEETLSEVPGVDSVDVDLGRGRAEVAAAQDVDSAALCELIDGLGYTASVREESPGAP